MRSIALPFAACLLFACTTETTTTSSPASTEPPHADDGEAQADDDAPRKDAGKAAAKDAGNDAPAAKPEWTSGESGKSCAEACKAAGKTCTASCTDHRSCGGHDGTPPPYAGYACYYHESKSGSGSFRSNEGRSLSTCDEVVTPKWEVFGTEYQLGDYLGNDPVSCCCQ